jgi:hypothetical protein
MDGMVAGWRSDVNRYRTPVAGARVCHRAELSRLRGHLKTFLW